MQMSGFNKMSNTHLLWNHRNTTSLSGLGLKLNDSMVVCVYYLHLPYRYLSPVRPGHRVLPPPECPGTPTSQVSLPQAQTPQHPRSNSLSLFYKKRETRLHM